MSSIQDDSPFLTPNAERNFPVIVEEQKLYVYKDWLTALSPVFDRMIKSDFAESKQGFIKLKEKKFDDILELFGILFPVTTVRKSITWENIEKMIGFADEYDIEQLRVEIRIHLNLKTSLDRLKYGENFCIKYANYAWQVRGCLEILKRCIPFICQAEFTNNCLPYPVLIAAHEARYSRLLSSMPKKPELVQSGRFRSAEGVSFGFAIGSTSRADLPNTCSTCGSSSEMPKPACNNEFHSEECRNRYVCSRFAIKCSCGYTFDESILSQTN